LTCGAKKTFAEVAELVAAAQIAVHTHGPVQSDHLTLTWGTAAAASPPFRLGDPALCGTIS